MYILFGQTSERYKTKLVSVRNHKTMYYKLIVKI